jgi:hypothetical protein
VALLKAAKLKLWVLSLGHWKEAIFDVMTVLFVTKPSKSGPSMPSEALKALKSGSCSIYGSIKTNQGVFWQLLPAGERQIAPGMPLTPLTA